MPPDVGRQLAASGLLGGHEPGRHVRLPLDSLGVEPVAVRVLDVDEDRVVLRGPAALRLGAVVVGPDDLVQEALAAEELVEQKLRVVRLAIVEVEVERAARGEQSAQLPNPGLEEAQIVLERVRVRGLAEEPAGVAAPLEADAVAGLVGNDLERAPRDLPAGVEGRVRIDELEALVREARQDVQVVAEENEVVGRPLHAAHCRGANGRCRAGSRGARRAGPRPRPASRPARA